MERIRVIDYLKTFAILGVLLFHLGVISNGYLGVEVFFVVSGFLMMGKFKKDIEKNSFKPIKYILTRIFTFLPLISIVGILSLMLGFWYMLPDDYENLAQSIIASNLFANNLLQAITIKDYWNVANIYKPLMHTWYVGVLIQCLIFLTCILWGISKISKKYVKNTLIIVTIISFVFFCLPLFSDSDKFYLFPFRLFEITFGCLITYFPSSNLSNKTKSILGNVGIACVLFMLFSRISIFSSVRILIVIISTSLAIWGHESNKGYLAINEGVYRAFTLPGKYSYDVYIWHQAVIAFLYYSVFNELNSKMICMTFGATILLCLLSVSLRNKMKIYNWSHNKALFALVTAIIGCTVSFYVYMHAGVVRNVPELGIDVNNVHRHMHAEYCDIPYSWDVDFCQSDKIHVLVFGDSFGRDFANILKESKYSDQLEISYCFGYDLYGKENRLKQADYVFYGSNVWDTPKGLDDIPSDKLYRVGNKKFGNSNGIIYANRNKEWYKDQMVKLSENMIDNNNAMKEVYGDHYIDMITPLMVNDYIRVFTDDGYYISQDCSHLTKQGAEFYARILNLDFLLSKTD